jgi:hypothetical protein
VANPVPKAQDVSYRITASLNEPNPSRNQNIGLVLLIFLAVNLWISMNYIGPHEKLLARGPTSPTQGDLYPPWRGAQELILDKADPYGPEVSRDIQVGYYGRVLSDATGEQKDQQRFAYPVYVAILLSPFVSINFETVRTLFFWMLLLITLASVPLWLRFLQLRVSRLTLATLAAMTLSSVPIVQALNFQQLALLVAGLLAGCAVLLAKRQYFWAGVLLALASIKPQMSMFLTMWLMVWISGDWRKRRPLLWGFCLTLAALALAGELLLPGWIPKFLHGLAAYQHYTGGGNVLTRTLPKPVAVLAAGAAAAVGGLTGWRARRLESDAPGFAFAFALVLTLTVLVAPALAALFNQVLLLPGLSLLAFACDRWNASRQANVAAGLLALVTIAPWVLGTVAVGLSFFLPQVLHRFWLVPLFPSVLLPFAVVLGLSFLLKDIPGIGHRFHPSPSKERS